MENGGTEGAPRGDGPSLKKKRKKIKYTVLLELLVLVRPALT